MRVCLFSEQSQCFDVPQVDGQVTFVWTRPGEFIPEADVYVWNYAPKAKIDAAILSRPNRQHLVFADSDQLDRLASIRKLACILLKPVAPFTLKAFLDLAQKSCERSARSQAETARTEREDFVKYLQDVNLALQQSDHERTNFFACALHDLRAPLTAIYGYCGLLEEEKLGTLNGAQRELLERMQYSARRLMRLTSGAFEVAAEGRSPADGRSYPESDFAEVVRRALYDVDPLVREKGITIQVELEPPNARMFFEPEQIQQVVVNLLENSCKFNPRNGKIDIRGYSCAGGTRLAADGRSVSKPHRLSNGYRVDIADSGPGIPADLADKIFEPYTSFLRSSDRSTGGLGLAICRSILSAHQGMIWATPDPAGGHFSFILPAQNAKGSANSAWAGTELELEQAAS